MSLVPSISQAQEKSARLSFFETAIGRLVGVLLGASVQVLFLWTVYFLFQFLRYGGSESQSEFSPWLVGVLAVFFAWPHSLLLVPSVQKWTKRFLPAAFTGLLHCTATCLSLLLLFHFWTPSSGALWRLTGWSEQLMLLGFYGSWIGLFYSLYLTGLGYQTGLAPWWYWVRKAKPPRREFVERGIYRWMRHPVYLSFLGLIWFTPSMTYDHAILTVVWTIYIYLGSYLKDKRMVHFLGEQYADYARRVPGFLVIGFGPWARWSSETPDAQASASVPRP